ncbi:hypothetical protein [Paracoccus nototheniae]|uniref:DUF1236 domain-containing protein n=1 Tax=Paracoccus nototheniae TaxID=2489002 RepID=A0ABW4E3G1_9RHOB|nr:hypothetical protein [Paracoccus nototheniae]
MNSRNVIACGICAVAMIAFTLFTGPVGAPAEAGDHVRAAVALPMVGDIPDSTTIQMIDNLGAVGLGPDLPGSRYAVVGGHLVRIEAASGKILSVLRPLPRMPD